MDVVFRDVWGLLGKTCTMKCTAVELSKATATVAGQQVPREVQLLLLQEVLLFQLEPTRSMSPTWKIPNIKRGGFFTQHG